MTTQQETAAQSQEYVFQYAIVTPNGENYLTANGSGGLTAAYGCAISTALKEPSNDAYFTLVATGRVKGQWALQTPDGQHYVTFNQGGGIHGDNTSVIFTNAQVSQPEAWPSLWERFTIIAQPNGKCCLITSTGYYVTAVSGGGVDGAEAATTQALVTNATSIGPNETFTFQAVATM